ncbi:MATE family efflux transporter [Spiroplasma platyhelix]|uniref:Probable multidrug resistance protein NorM n=1 Tax=Spiroplasma platyhelix PALS-1 TaxID=1276218 RepID=A0A846U5K5_9MOLU|nr:MATE family efflux transporter [Spiroplasma platyhelix]MBE4704365.1 hypothetical protein [Spiroplasma platyhelix PALS-1]NKE38737.1 hypothetical protein [Spiroplasma platyhelix PALS-1]UJB28948.1 MATE efflux family protein [Spiroplasma platyhelix PALS-1]
MKKYWKDNLNFYSKGLLFIIPISLQALVETVLGLMNTFIVGQFGNDDVIAGVASSVNVYDMIWYVFFAIVATGNIFLAQYEGANMKTKIKETTNVKLFYVLLISVICLIVLEVFAKDISILILGAHGGEHYDEAIKVATQYSRLIAWNYPLLGFAYIMSLTMNVAGNVKTPLIVASISLVLNTVLVCTLSLPYQGSPNLGIEGLAISLITSRAVECLIFIGYLIYKKPEYAPNWNIFKISKELHWNYFKAFIPMFINQLFFGLSLIIQTVIFAYYGSTTVVAATSIVSTTMAIFYSTYRGYNALVSYYVGQNLGKGKLALAKENAKKILQLVFLISVVTALVILSCAFWVPRFLFVNLSAEGLSLAIWYLAFSAIGYFFFNMMQPIFSFLYAGGYTLIVSITDLCLVWIVDIFVTFALLQWTQMDIKYVMMISCLTKSIDFAVSYVLYRVVPWNKKIISKSEIKLPKAILE